MITYIEEHYMERIALADIAYEYGFNGASYYCETFRKYYGMPTLIYKKAQSAG